MEAPVDLPRLHSNPLFAALQLLGWLLFAPSAWQRYLAKIDPALAPDFALVELSAAHWRRRPIQQLVLTGCVLLPLIAGASLVCPDKFDATQFVALLEQLSPTYYTAPAAAQPSRRVAVGDPGPPPWES